jgi:predicted HD phosphohydrolase
LRLHGNGVQDVGTDTGECVMKKVSFIHMADGTAEDYQIIAEAMESAHNPLADDLLELLQKNEGHDIGYQVSRLEHSLQSATHAFRDGQDEEMVVAALMHDIADTIAPYNPADVAAGILRPYVSDRTHWVVKYHGLFQTYYYAHHFGNDRNQRDKYQGHPHFQAYVDFCEKYDQNAFDPNFDTMPLSAFEPMVRRIFARKPGFDMASRDVAA